MELVEPIKDQNKIDKIKKLLKNRYNQIYLDIFEFGLNSALRISDLLKLKFNDFDTDNYKLTIIETKTGKTNIIEMNEALISIFEQRKKNNTDDEYLFTVHSNRQKGKPISRQSVSRVFKEVGEDRTINIKLNTHSLRKTRGFHLYENGKSIELICKMLNHSTPAVTMRYIGIDQKNVDDSFTQFVL